MSNSHMSPSTSVEKSFSNIRDRIFGIASLTKLKYVLLPNLSRVPLVRGLQFWHGNSVTQLISFCRSSINYPTAVHPGQLLLGNSAGHLSCPTKGRLDSIHNVYLDSKYILDRFQALRQPGQCNKRWPALQSKCLKKNFEQENWYLPFSLKLSGLLSKSLYYQWEYYFISL